MRIMVFKCQTIIKMFKFSSIVFLMFFTIMVPKSEGRARKSCGSLLADRIAIACNGEYNELYWTDNEPQTRVRRGIVDECCRNSCTDSQLKRLYCMNKDDSVAVSDDSSVYVSNEEHPPEEQKKVFHDPFVHLKVSSTPEIGTVAPEFNLRGMIPPQYRTQDIRFH
ncbi:uncharacterized protein LOC129789545 [Lutzomyia longipalpis]|nr:uncharacterized protein LOC129789545 [Lutzomyia longipalpis]XP_055682382.1 uncharacterized protein LOC129789545 [Lutzomyia longipalpis]